MTAVRMGCVSRVTVKRVLEVQVTRGQDRKGFRGQHQIGALFGIGCFGESFACQGAGPTTGQGAAPHSCHRKDAVYPVGTQNHGPSLVNRTACRPPGDCTGQTAWCGRPQAAATFTEVDWVGIGAPKTQRVAARPPCKSRCSRAFPTPAKA